MNARESGLCRSNPPTPQGKARGAGSCFFTAYCLLPTAYCDAVHPREVIRLFNGRDLAGLSTWLKDTKRDDPRRVFRVTDGLLHITGDGYGYLATDKAYR